jgi:hypothetical protein
MLSLGRRYPSRVIFPRQAAMQITVGIDPHSCRVAAVQRNVDEGHELPSLSAPWPCSICQMIAGTADARYCRYWDEARTCRLLAGQF